MSYRAHGGSFELTVRSTESWLETRGGRVRMALGGANAGARMQPLESPARHGELFSRW